MIKNFTTLCDRKADDKNAVRTNNELGYDTGLNYMKRDPNKVFCIRKSKQFQRLKNALDNILS